MYLNDEKALHNLKIPKPTKNTTKRTIDFHGRTLKWLRKLSQRWLLMAKVTHQNREPGFFWQWWGEKSRRKSITTPCRENTQKKGTTLQFFCTLETETLTAANLLIGCLETRKQEVFSHCCQD